ncbi:hypothetical protein V8E53_008322 [Lactarius tabidus]
MYPASSRTGSSTLSYPTASPIQSNFQQVVHPPEARMFTGTLPERKEADATQMHYVTSYSAAELRTFNSERQEDRPWCVPQMSTARGRNGGRRGGVKGVIAPDPGPAEPDDPDEDDF